MIITKHTAELIPLVVNDIYGELPSIVIQALILRGPSRLPQLLEPTGLTPREVKHGLAVLNQFNLIHYSTAGETGPATYEANISSCYNALRIGKIDAVIGRKYGLAEQEVVRSLNAFGLVALGDIAKAFGAQSTALSLETTTDNGTLAQVNTEHDDQDGGVPARSAVVSVFHLHEIVARLIQLEVLDVVDGAEDFANPKSVLGEIDERYLKRISAAKGSRAKEDLGMEKVLKMREARNRTKQLKRRLDSEHGYPDTKKRKLANGSAHGESTASPGSRRIILEPNIMVKLNYEKCLVDLRNESLVQFVEDNIGPTTAKVYASLLHLVTRNEARCKPDSRIDGVYAGQFADDASGSRPVSSIDVLEMLDATTDVETGIAKVAKDKLHEESRSENAAGNSVSLLDMDSSEEEETSQPHPSSKRQRVTAVVEDSDDDEIDLDGSNTQQNGSRQKGVKFDSLPPEKDSRLEAVCRHLMLLCTDSRGFARQSSRKGDGRYTVDFDVAMASLRESHIDAIVEATAGRHGLRLVNTLKHLGKLDEKTLATKTFLPKAHIQATMAKLLDAGFVDVQEVPKDNSRVVDRAFSLWSSEKERIRRVLPDKLCKMMARCLQVRDVEKHKVRDILDFVRRTDVQGQVEEVLDQTYFRRYREYQDKESRLLTSIFRLDDIVACLRDF